MSKPNHDSIRQEVSNLVRELRLAWPASDIPDELYHYTDAKGLLGILTNKSFWATDINFLNDAMEVKYASDLIDKILDSKLKEGGDEDLNRFLNSVRRFMKLRPSTWNSYVTCFCEKGNLLSQWRAYGASGAGYSIGVITETLKVSERDEPGSPILETRLRQIIYVKEVQEYLVTEAVDRFCRLFLRVLGELDKEHSDSIINEFANDLSAELSEYLYCFKSPVFEEEQEWRVINTVFYPFARDKDTLQFRVSGGNVIPYVEFGFAAPTQPFVARGYPISNITIGPGLHPEHTERSLYVLLEWAFGDGNGVRIIISDIPFRRTTV